MTGACHAARLVAAGDIDPSSGGLSCCMELLVDAQINPIEVQDHPLGLVAAAAVVARVAERVDDLQALELRLHGQLGNR